MTDHDEAEFRDYVQARMRRFRREAYALCGDWHEAEDLVQHAMEKLYPRWRRVHLSGTTASDAYVRAIFYNKFLDARKSSWWRRVDRSGFVPDAPGPDELRHDARDALLVGLLRLPRDQRAVLVLRYWMDQSIEDTAEILDFSIPKVKTLSSRGCAAMRGLLHVQEGVDE